MRKYILGITLAATLSLATTVISWTSSTKKSNQPALSASTDSLFSNYLKGIYDRANLAATGLNMDVFEKAVTGYYNLRNSGKISSDKSILTIADFDLNSTKKRMWIVDLDKKVLLLNTWVAHGQNTGADKALKFSNTNNSFQSSLGFYVTGEVYNGQHGKSLRLDGMDEGFNSNARQRSIVVHGAEYVSQGTINALGRLGRSQGCPAVAPELANLVINTIEGKTVLFINSSDRRYTSKYLNEHTAAMMASQQHQQVDETVLDTALSI